MHSATLVLSDEQRRQLEALVRRPTTPQGLAKRTRIVLAADSGRTIAALLVGLD